MTMFPESPRIDLAAADNPDQVPDPGRKARLDALAAQIGTPPARPNIWFGAVGPHVAYLQERLEAAGLYNVAEGDEAGQFGGLTERALRAFQTGHGLAATAICDDACWQALR